MADRPDRKAPSGPTPDPSDAPRKPPAAGAPDAKADAGTRVVPPFPPAELVSPHGAG